MQKLSRLYAIAISDRLGIMWLCATLIAIYLAFDISLEKALLVIAVQSVYTGYRVWRLRSTRSNAESSETGDNCLKADADTVTAVVAMYIILLIVG